MESSLIMGIYKCICSGWHFIFSIWEIGNMKNIGFFLEVQDYLI